MISPLMASYETHMLGKWDVGMATLDHTPSGRGYKVAPLPSVD